ncbi:MAG: low temperature requirement protein A [Bacteroidota bacterium]
MKKKSNTLINWWQKPRDKNDFEEYRQVSFLELFYDLVYVALIAQISHSLADEVSVHGIIKFIFIFTMVWWYWLNGTLYHDLHGNNDIRTRVFTFLQMICVVGMAIFASKAFHSGSIGFTISAIVLLVVLFFLWWRVGHHQKQFKPLSNLYGSIIIINIGLLSSSLFLVSPQNKWLWVAATLICFLSPIFLSMLSFLSDRVKIEHTTQASSSLVERFGLFIIIVLGEIITAVVSGSSSVKLSNRVAALCFLGILIAIGIWWLYYDFISHRKPKRGSSNHIIWYYLHLPLTIGITGVGASILYIIKHVNEYASSIVYYLFSSSMAVIVFCIAILLKVLDEHSETSKYLNNNTNGLLVIACIYFGLMFTKINTVLLLAISVLLLFVPILSSMLKNYLNITKTN